MGVDFAIENDPRWFVSGTGKTWRGEQTWEREELGNADHLLSVDSFFGYLEEGDVRTWSERIEPPLPEDLELPGAHWAYSGFMRFRERVAMTVDVWLPMTWGFQPSALVIGEHRGLSKDASTPALDYKVWEVEQIAWWEERATKWDDIDTPLGPFLYHSDCDGELSPDECSRVAPALREALGRLPSLEEWQTKHREFRRENRPPADPMPEHLDDNDRVNGERLVTMMEACARYGRRLLFR